MSRIDHAFRQCRQQGRTAFIPFMTAGDPDFATSLELLKAMPAAGADIIEIGMPFSDPMADGPVIQRANQRALKNTPNLTNILKLVRDFREHDNATPVVLMGYFNPVFIYGAQDFARDAAIAGVDAMLIVDLPPEESSELRPHLGHHDIDMIRMITPTTDAERLPDILKGAGGFLYCVAVAGVTGASGADASTLRAQIDTVRQQSSLPVAIGFGISSASDVRDMGTLAEAVVVGSALVRNMENEDAKQAQHDYLCCLNELNRDCTG